MDVVVDIVNSVWFETRPQSADHEETAVVKTIIVHHSLQYSVP